MYMLIILEIIDIFFYLYRSIAERLLCIVERLSARRRTPEAPIPLTPEEPIPPMDAMSLCFIYN